MVKMIRLNNHFVVKDSGKYYLTNVTKVSEWKNMNESERLDVKGKNVTNKIKRLLKKHKPKGNINFKTNPSKKKMKTKKKSKKVGG